MHYFEVEKIGGCLAIEDPDHLIFEVDWKSADEIEKLDLSFEEDRKFLLDFIRARTFFKRSEQN
ncbi:hypothetical protein WMZ97_13525 [Lentibacillus sp. N15]|uniref:hypothetical protein n=1 Tax=Lentibacillus songyuanensis TaxID=3136161 RepID=UPI0031BAE33C